MVEPQKTDGKASAKVVRFKDGASPAEIIQKKRKAVSLDIDDIHEKTLIPVWKLKALESGEYDQLGNKLFVKGYIRQIAKLLELEAEPLIEDVLKAMGEDTSLEAQKYQASEEGETEADTAKYPAEKPEKKAASLNSVNSATPSSAWVKNKLQFLWSPWSFLGVVVVWVVIFWLYQAENTAENTEVQTVATEEVVGPDSPSAPVVSETDENTATESAASASLVLDDDIGEDSVDVVSDEEVNNTETEAAQLHSLEEYVQSPDPVLSSPNDSLVRPAETPSLNSVQEPSSPVVVDTTEPMDPNISEDTLIIAFSDDCWVKVTDINEKVLFAKMQYKGDNLRLSGYGPFDVVLGNARVAALTINGRAVDTEPKGSTNYRRLTVSP